MNSHEVFCFSSDSMLFLDKLLNDNLAMDYPPSQEKNMTARKLSAILGACLLLISGCSNSIPVSNEQISKELIAQGRVTVDSGKPSSVRADGTVNLESSSLNTIIFNGKGNHCFTIDSHGFLKDSGYVNIILSTYSDDGFGLGLETYGYGKAYLEYEKKGNVWSMTKMSISNTPEPFRIAKATEEVRKSHVNLSKSLCDNFDSSKPKSK